MNNPIPKFPFAVQVKWSKFRVFRILVHRQGLYKSRVLYLPFPKVDLHIYYNWFFRNDTKRNLTKDDIPF